MEYVARQYQESSLHALRSFHRKGIRRMILQSATGSGKTVTASFLIRGFAEKNNNLPWNEKKYALFLANQRDLVFQASGKLNEFGIDHGIIMAGEEEKLWESVQVASVQSFINRVTKDPMYIKDFALIIVDECQGSICPTFKHVFEMFPDCTVIGLSATPCGPGGRGLGEVYQAIHQSIPIKELVSLGNLLPVTYYVPNTVDLSKMKVAKGKDYTEEQRGKIDKKVNTPKLIGNIFTQWKRICSDRQTIIYCNSISHSKSVSHFFCINGINAEHIDGNTKKEEREGISNRFKTRKTQVVCNCEVWTQGKDLPICSCIVVARPTKSLRLWHQMIGRGMRPYEDEFGKQVDMICIDHTGAFYELFPVDIEITWSLDGKEIAYQQNEKQKKESKLIQCKECPRVFSGRIDCPDCGWKARSNGKPVEYIEADLEEAKTPTDKFTKEQKQRFYSMALHYSRSKGYKDGWASNKFRERFNVWPRSIEITPVEPDQAFLSYMKHLQIRWAKSRQKRECAV